MKRFLAILSITTIPLLLGIIPLVTSAVLIEFKNPITSGNVMGLIQSVINQLFPIAVTICALVILYIGFRMAIASGSGNATEFTKWAKNLRNALIYIAIIAGAKAIIEAVRIFGESISQP